MKLPEILDALTAELGGRRPLVVVETDEPDVWDLISKLMPADEHRFLAGALRGVREGVENFNVPAGSATPGQLKPGAS